MIQEYLFADKSKKDEVKEYAPAEEVEVKITDLKNSDCWTISYSISRNDETAAKKLSEIDEYIVKTFHPTVLANESAAYFNKTLFPLANDFERKLRKLLYLKGALSPDGDVSKTIINLESQDLGQIFELLFVDPNLADAAKTKINNKKFWPFTKAKLHATIDEMEENTLWERLIGAEAVPDLVANFAFVKKCRNDIMHAHNIHYIDFKTTRELFRKINEQIDSEIDKIISASNSASPIITPSDYNTVLSNALTNMKIQSALNDLNQTMTAIRTTIPTALYELQEYLDNIVKRNSPNYEKLSKILEELNQEISFPYFSKPDGSAKGEKASDEQTKETK